MPNIPQLPALGITTEVLNDILPPLPTAKAVKIAVLACGVKVHFPWAKTCRKYDEAVEVTRLSLAGENIEILRAETPYEDPYELLATADRMLAEGIQGVVLFHAAYTAGEIGSQFGRWLLDHNMPVLSWSHPDERGGNLEANSLCCQNFLLQMFQRLGVRCAWMHNAVDNTADEMLGRFARSVRARAQFRNGKLLHIGGSRVTAFYDGEVDELAVMRRFGVRFDRMDLEVAYQRGQKFKQSDVQRLRDSIVNNPRCAKVDVPDEQIFKTLRFGMAIHDMATEGGYIGCTVKSWPELFDYYGCAIDGAVSMLNDAGLCTVEEGEMNGLLSSMAMHLLSQGKAIPTLMDLSAADAATNRLGIWHCGACPTRIMKPGASFEARKHTILENGNPQTAVGLMIEFLLAHGPATVVRYQAPDAARMIAFEGNLVETPMAFRGAYCEMEPTAGTTAAQILNTIMSDGLDHHWSLGYGHLKDDLLMLNHFIGVENIAIRRNNVMSGLSTW